ncbi:MAG: NAD(+) synthase [Oscillospiraceae bacterium]|nr:NAD(+) synthase [Oscillospiraceae bacterium]
MLDYIRIACAVPAVQVGDVKKNTEDICKFITQADSANVDVIVFPELAMTGFTCADLFFQNSLHNAVRESLNQILERSSAHPNITAVVGLPVPMKDKLINGAAVISNGTVHGIVPKTYVPNYGESNEMRWFSSGAELLPNGKMDIPGYGPVDTKLLFDLGDGAVLGVELCEDLFSPLPVSTQLALNGATVIVNPSASHETLGKRQLRRKSVLHQSEACRCIYAFCSAGCTESTTDLVYSGHSIFAENGEVLQENRKYLDSDYMLIQDCDLGKVIWQRRKNSTFRDAVTCYTDPDFVTVRTSEQLRTDGSLYPTKKSPFLPNSDAAKKEACLQAFQLQAAGLRQRLCVLGTNAVLGISGGLDSTLALLAAVEAMKQLGRPASDIYCVTMPCFGTSDRTYRNAWELMQKLGVNAREISIRDAVSQHFRDIGHDASVHNGTYENSQARERTQILMDYASVVNGIVIGTGDLSESALGWCTFNGDHMSMYSVNASIPKTMIPEIIEAVMEKDVFATAKDVLQDILNTPISPELLPPDAQGKISQQTEDLVGPYVLHDFFLYHMLQYGFTPTKIYTLACRTFQGEFDNDTIKKWIKVFYRRFFTQQFKRNCAPDGIKATPLGFSPRGDWQMPSDASGRVWLDEIESL